VSVFVCVCVFVCELEGHLEAKKERKERVSENEKANPNQQGVVRVFSRGAAIVARPSSAQSHQ